MPNLKHRILWVTAHHARLTFYLQESGAAIARVSLFVPDVDGEEHPDVEQLRLLFEAPDKNDPKQRPIGRVDRQPCKNVEGTWFNVWRLSALERVTDQVLSVEVTVPDRALWQSFRSVLRCAPSRARDAIRLGLITPEGRLDTIREFQRIARLKIHERAEYPRKALIDSDVVLGGQSLNPIDYSISYVSPAKTPSEEAQKRMRTAEHLAARYAEEIEQLKISLALRAKEIEQLQKDVDHWTQAVQDNDAHWQKRLDKIRNPKDSYLTRHPERATLSSTTKGTQ